MRKLILLGAMALAALALMAPSAFGQVEVVDEATGTMCDDTALTYCEDEIVSTHGELEVHTIFGTITYVCEVDVPFHVQTNGSGKSEEEHIVDNPVEGTGNCDDLDPCMEPWTAQLSEEVGEEAISTQICISGIATCEGTLDTHFDKVGHHYGRSIAVEFTSHTGTHCEFEGPYEIANDSIEIKH